MSHNFHSGVFFEEGAWHNLGLLEPEPLPPREAFRLAQADFSVLAAPADFQIPGEATRRPQPGYQNLYRSDTGDGLSIVSNDYEIIQNEVLIQIAEQLREDTTMSCVVCLRGGRRVSFSAKIINLQADVLPGDEVRTYLVVATSHDRSLALRIIFTATRVVCDNTLHWAIDTAGGSNILTLKHATGVNRMLKHLPDLMDLHRRQFTGGVEELKAMAHKPCLEDDFSAYVTEVYRQQLARPVVTANDDGTTTSRPRVLEDLRCWPRLQEAFEDGTGMDIPGVRGTYWGAYQAISQELTHSASSSKDPIEAARARMESIYWGSNAQVLSKAHELALAATR